MDKHYQPHQIEKKWYQHWEQSGFFAPSDAGARHYCIMQPPPNVTGTLHMGHGFQLTLMDILIRYHRMMGDKTLWQAGTDHAGIATQMVVERRLAKENTTRHDLGREAFVDKIWEWKHFADDNIKTQMRRMGTSLDWPRACFTMDPHFNEAVIDVFVRLYREGLIYRGKRLVNWDPVLHTAVSDLEVVSNEESGHLWHFRYPIEDRDEHIVIATTRPETMLGDSAVAVHPDDARYQHLVGQHIRLPICDRLIPIIADSYVDPEFGSGCVKITPAHDFNDYAVGMRHNCELINILNDDATLSDDVPEGYRGLSREAAREKVCAAMDSLGLLEKVDDHTLSIPRGDRSNAILEPYLTDQWFVKATELAPEAIKVVADNEIQFVPENWKKTYFGWMENIQDWCISRQLWWGHRIPAWYDNEGNLYVAQTEQGARDFYNLDESIELKQDDDVLDTWFSSSLWPFATLGWPESTPQYKDFYPTNVLVTGFDIIFFWVARMIMMGLKFTQKIPFKEVYVTGLIRDSHGQKMSKSKGNVLDPIDLIDGIELEALVTKRTQGLMQPQMAKSIEKATRDEFPDGIKPHGTDALRFTYTALATHGRDIRFDMKRLEGYHNFCNKLWNASRYVLMNTEQFDINAPGQTSVADDWIISELQQLTEKVHEYFKAYRFDLIAAHLYEFIWNEYCDWYLELSKPILYGDDVNEAAKNGTRRTLLQVLERVLRLAHPVMPFITEEIWAMLKDKLDIDEQTIMLRPYPIAVDELRNDEATQTIAWLKQIIVAVRNIRGEMNISPNKAIPLLFARGDDTDRSHADSQATYLMNLAKLDSVRWLEADEKRPLSATAVVGQLEVLIPLAGLIDVNAELDRIRKSISKTEVEIIRLEKKLSNPNFVDKAPEAVVAGDKAKLQAALAEKTKYDEQLLRLREFES